MFSQIEYFFKRSVFLGIFRFSVFLFLFIVSRYLYFYLGTWQLVLPELNSVIESLRSLILHVSAAFFSLFYHNVSIAPDGVLAFGGKGFIQVIYGCTGIIQISQITIILLLYPISWRQKLYLFPLSIVIMIVAAIIHFLILVPIAYHFPGWFPLFHNHLSRIIFFGIVFVTWLFWERVRIDKPAVSVNSSDKSISPGQGVIVNRIRPDQRKNRLTRMVALLAINALVIFYVTVIAAPLGASFPWLQKIIYFEKIVSFMLYTVIAFLALYTSSALKNNLANVKYGILLTIAFGFLMEILHQLISPASRTFESLGLVANLFGVITGALLFYFYLCRLNAMNAGPVVPEQEA